MKDFKVGDYSISYSEEELSQNLPKNIFFDFLQQTPIVHNENILNDEEKQIIYHNCLSNFDKRSYATIHDYSKGVEAYSVDVNGRFTHFIPILPNVYNLLEKKLVNIIYPLLKSHYKINGEFKHVEGWQLLGYGEEFFFKPHCDNSVSGSASKDIKDRQYRWWCNVPNRKFTVLLYLNDCDEFPTAGEYSGGQLSLSRIKKNGKNIEFFPKTGTLIAMPANFLFMHEVKPVTRGYRFAAVTWIDVI